MPVLALFVSDIMFSKVNRLVAFFTFFRFFETKISKFENFDILLKHAHKTYNCVKNIN